LEAEDSFTSPGKKLKKGKKGKNQRQKKGRWLRAFGGREGEGGGMGGGGDLKERDNPGRRLSRILPRKTAGKLWTLTHKTGLGD